MNINCVKNEKGKVSIFNIILMIILISIVFFILDNFDIGIFTNKNLMMFNESNKVHNNAIGNDVVYVESTNGTNGGNITSINVTNMNSISETKEVNKYTRYFYNQLNSSGKQMYNTIMSNTASLKQGTAKIEFNINDVGMENEFQSVWDAICLDKPEIFYIDTTKISFITQTSKNFFGKTSYNYYMEPKTNENYFVDTWKTPIEVTKAINLVESKADEIIKAGNMGSTYEKVKYAHDYIVNNVEYNKEASKNNSNIYGALIEGKAVCEGYAEAFKYLMDIMQIPCVLVYGNGINDSGNTEYHSWNEVLMDDNKWYAVDTTWDDPIIIGNGKLPKENRYSYFLKGANNFNSSHIKQADVSGTGQNFSYPELSQTDYKK